MKQSMMKKLWGLVVLFSLSMCLTSCEDVLGHWEKPTPKIPEFNVTSISLDKTSLVLYIDGGENTATLKPTLVGDPGLHKVFFSSSRPWVATVDEETGEVTAVDGGETTITASIGGLLVDCEVKVYHKKYDISTGDAVIPANEQWEIIGTSNTYKITIGEQAYAVLNGVKITSTNGSCIETDNTGGGSNIILVDGTTNTMTTTHDGFAAINTAGGQLNIFGQTAGTGKLEANGGIGGAGIGGNKNGNYSSIVIMGGKIGANGGSGAAGIGTGQFEDASVSAYGDITISGGIVTAKGGDNAAGIGTGYQKSGTNAATCGGIKIEKTVVSVTAIKGSAAPNPIGKGHTAISTKPVCGKIFFDTEKVAESAYDGASAYTTAPTAGTYGGLTLAISTTTNADDTWTLTPAN